MDNKRLSVAKLTLVKWAAKVNKTRIYKEDFANIYEAAQEVAKESASIVVYSESPLSSFIRACLDNFHEYATKGPGFRLEYGERGGVREYVNPGYLTDFIARALFIGEAVDHLI